LSAEVLRAAGGQVRCGKCGEVFNALAHLAEDSSAFASGESAFDLEARADSILESFAKVPPRGPPAAAADFAPPGVEIARLQILDWNGEDFAIDPAGSADPPAEESQEPLGESSLEFTLPPGELDRIFVEAKTSKRPSVPQDADPPKPQPAGESDPLLTVEIISDNRAKAPAGLEISDIIRREMLEGLDPEVAPFAPARPAIRRSHALWLAAAIASALLLAAQVVHQNREWIGMHAPLGGTLQALYAALGAPIAQPANLSVYELRQWGVTGDPSADGTLRVRASILNTAAQREPYPLLRVTLANRFGTSIGSRDFEPAEYAGKPVARPLAPGERIDATMDILDPGKSAEGFEIDVCLRGAGNKMSCANDAAAAKR